MIFLPLFNLQLIHDYYTDSRCPDFQLEPTLCTRRLLQNHRGVIKYSSNTIQVVITATDAKQPFIPLQRKLKFRFNLRLQNSIFTLFTDLAELKRLTNPIYTNSDQDDGTITPLLLISRPNIVTEQFAVAAPASAEAFTLSGRPLTGLQPADFLIKGLDQVTAPTHYLEGAKIITLDSSASNTGQRFQITYAAIPPKKNGILAQIEIGYDDSWPALANGPKTFQITFQPKTARWKYYIIADPGEAQLKIEDRSDTPILFGAANQTDLTETPDEADLIAVRLAEQYPAMRRLRFVSDDLVHCRQKPRPSLQLMLDNKKVLGPLPTPSVQNLSTFDVIQNDEQHKEDALYQIVKYFKH